MRNCTFGALEGLWPTQALVLMEEEKFSFSSTHLDLIGQSPANETDKRQVSQEKKFTYALCINMSHVHTQG